MRIEAYSQVIQAYQTKKANAPKTTTATSFRDQLNISSVGKDIQISEGVPLFVHVHGLVDGGLHGVLLLGAEVH